MLYQMQSSDFICKKMYSEYFCLVQCNSFFKMIVIFSVVVQKVKKPHLTSVFGLSVLTVTFKTAIYTQKLNLHFILGIITRVYILANFKAFSIWFYCIVLSFLLMIQSVFKIFFLSLIKLLHRVKMARIWTLISCSYCHIKNHTTKKVVCPISFFYNQNK